MTNTLKDGKATNVRAAELPPVESLDERAARSNDGEVSPKQADLVRGGFAIDIGTSERVRRP